MFEPKTEIPQFGEWVPVNTYVDRPVVYAIGLNARGKLLITKARGCYALPGGGVEADETLQEALVREVLEETGWAIEIVREICKANQWTYSSRKDTHFNKQATFYLVRVIKRMGRPIEPDHEARWMSHAKAVSRLRRDFHRYALGRCARKGWYRKIVPLD